MYADPQFISRQVVERQERVARDIGRVVVCLLAALTILSVTTYHGYAMRAAACREVKALDASKFHIVGESVTARIKAAQEECQ